MQEFQANGRTFKGYLAVPEQDSGPGVLVLHAWWGLTDIFTQVCDRLAQAGFVALAPDLYHGKTTTSVEEAETLAGALNRDEERVNADLAGAVQALRQQAGGRGKLAIIGFSMGGAYALDLSIKEAEQIAAVVTFYCAYSGLDYSRASAAYLCHIAENDPFDPPEAFAETEQEIQAAGKQATFYTYPGTSHWFFEENRPEYNAEAAHLAWERTLQFLREQLD